MAENITGVGALSRRDFLTGSAVAAAGAAMLGLAAVEPATAAETRSGNWAADGSAAVAAEPSAATNATAADGTYREHNASSFPADDATPIPPRAVPARWDYECDICVVGAGTRRPARFSWAPTSSAWKPWGFPAATPRRPACAAS